MQRFPEAWMVTWMATDPHCLPGSIKQTEKQIVRQNQAISRPLQCLNGRFSIAEVFKHITLGGREETFKRNISKQVLHPRLEGNGSGCGFPESRH